MRKPTPYLRHRSFYVHATPVASVGKLIVVMIGFELAFYLTPMTFGSQDYGVDENGASRVTPVDTLLEFGMFIVPCLGLLLLLRLVHQRSIWHLIGPAGAAWTDLKRVFWWVLIVLLLQEPMRILGEWDYIAEVRPLDQWLLWILPGMAVLLIQVGTEELYFRGYLQQFLAAMNPSPWLWLVVPSIFFGLSHIMNAGDPVDGVIWAYWATLLGLACGDLTARTGNLGAAIGLHLANNAMAMFVLGTKGWPASGLVLLLYPFEGFDGTAGVLHDGPGSVAIALVYSTLSVWLMWMAARVAVRH